MKKKQKIAELEARIAELEAANKDLDDRLRNIFDFTKNDTKQALLTLRTDIARSLKLENEDYLKLLDMPLSEETYAFAKATLINTFRALKRNGIAVKESDGIKKLELEELQNAKKKTNNNACCQ